MKLIKRIISFEFLLILSISSYTLYGLIQSIDIISTDKEWKFYFVLMDHWGIW